MSAPEASRNAAPPVRALAHLGSLSLAIQSALDADTLARNLAEHLLHLARADRAAVLLLREDTGDLEGCALALDPPGWRRLEVIPEPNGFLGQVLRRESVVVSDSPEHQGGGCGEIGWNGAGCATVVGLPLLAGTDLLGVAILGYALPRRLTDRRRRVFVLFAEQIALAVDRVRTRRELETASRRLDEAQAALRRVDQAKSDLISVVSHEMRTPLTAIKAYTESLLDNLDQPSFTMQQKFLTVINEECDRLARMVNDVLDLSRMESGKRRLRAEPLTLAAVVADALPMVEPVVQERGLRIRADLPSDLPRVEADLDLLKQVFVNLLHNAAKFSPPGREIFVRASHAEELVRVTVEDQGSGIPAEKLHHVFERFYRVEDAGAARTGGTGLGLAIVKSVVELHGGAIRVESEVGRGTRFVFELPLVQRGFRTLIHSLEPLFIQPPLRAVMEECVAMVAEVMEARIVSFMFLDEEGTELHIQAFHGLDQDTVGRTRVRVGDSIAGWVALNGEPLLVRDVETDRRFRKMNHPQYETHSLLCVPLRIAGETVGVVNVNNKAAGAEFDEDDLRLLVAIVKRVATALQRLYQRPEDRDVAATLASLRAIVRARRHGSLPSTQRAFKLATELGRRLGLAEDDIEVLGYVARVHDVGMLTVGDALWHSPVAWSEREHRQIESHPQSGVRLLQPIEFTSKVNEIILAHHEHMDGRGYPRGLKGEQIPLAARILAAVDAFESLTVGRPYRDPVPDLEALAELRRAAGTQFDPRVVDALESALRDRAAGAFGRAAARAPEPPAPSRPGGSAPAAAPSPARPRGTA